MSRRTPALAPARARATSRGTRLTPALAGRIAAVLLLLHLGLLTWVSMRNSVTFDESFHVPAGVLIWTQQDFLTSYAQPPLAKALFGGMALIAGARPPAQATVKPGAERYAGYSFMHINAQRFRAIYGAARLPALLMSVLLGAMVFALSLSWLGPWAGLTSLCCYVLAPDVLAHGSLAGVDMPTALVSFGGTIAFAAFARAGGLRRWIVVALWTAAAFLVRFSAPQLFVAWSLLLVALAMVGRLRRPRRAWLGLLALAPVALIAVNLGYLAQGTLLPLSSYEFQSGTWRTLQHAWPSLRLPLPRAYVEGLDYLGFIAKPGEKASYVLGVVRRAHVWWYFPLALAIKWPLGWNVSLVCAAFRRAPWAGSRGRAREATLLVPAAVMLGVAMASNLDYGVRYVLPLVPLLAVWIGGLAAHVRGPSTGRWLAWTLVAAIAIESVRALPYPLSHFNVLAGGPGGGDRIVNDSNVDWGQGLVALHDELERRGIRRVHLSYHGTVDARLYGIDYVPYAGGTPGTESEWLAISSYYFVGLPARMTSYLGQTDDLVQFDMSSMRNMSWAAKPAGCIYLFKVR